jgi:hypothetical protein
MIKGSYGRLRGERVNPAPGDRVAELPGIEPLLEGFVIAHEAITAFLDRRRPDAVMIFNGLFYQERLLSELARQRGIRVLAHENSCFADRKIFDPSGYVGNCTSVVAATWPSVRARVLSAAQRRRLEDYLEGVYRGAQNTIRHDLPAAAERVRSQLNLGDGSRIALLLGQVPFDTVIIYDLHIFQSQLEFLSRTIEIFRSLPDYTLVVRLHPWEHEKFGDRTYHELQRLDLPPNVRFVSGRELNTYSLMRMADFGITATSQSGLEMLSMMKPLVVAGEAFYAHKGFTHDVPSAALFEPVIREAAAHPVLEEHRRRLLRSFLYHVIFEHQIAFDREHELFPPASAERIERLLRSGAFTIDTDCDLRIP